MDSSGEGRAVRTIFNRRELFIAASMQEQAPYPRNIGPGRDRLPRIHTRTGGLWIAMARGECLRALLFLWRWHRRDWRRSHLLAL